MKKLLSVLLVLALVLGCAAAVAAAEADDDSLSRDADENEYETNSPDDATGYEPEPEGLFKFTEQYEVENLADIISYEIVASSDEENKDGGWMIVYAEVSKMHSQVPAAIIIKDKRIRVDVSHYPFTFLYGLYDRAQEKFFGIDEIDFDDYEGLYETFFAIDFGNVGPYTVTVTDVTDEKVPGDANSDGEVTVADATRIQRYCAKMVGEDEIDLEAADVTGDGEVTVLDATRIQCAVAKLCNIDGSDYSAD